MMRPRRGQYAARVHTEEDAVNELGKATLRELLVGGYGELKARLTQRLGSAELASDVLQETWVRLERAAPLGPVHLPKAYLFRIAYNIALKRRRAERETVTLDDARNVLDLVEDTPDPSSVVESRSEVALLRKAVAELTLRQREILFASRLDNVPLAKLAVRHGISQRWVERELRYAVLHCARRLDRKAVRRFGPKPHEGSIDREEYVQKGRHHDDGE
jgi:RNA polymerase sigma-70 factor (ECF subfamily)